MKNYINADDVLNSIETIFDFCLQRTTGIDAIALSLNFQIIAYSESLKPQYSSYNSIFIPSLLANLIETSGNTLGHDSSLYYASLMTRNPNGKLQAWTVVYPYKDYQLAFLGDIDKNSQLKIHQGIITEYVDDLLPLIEAYDNLI